MPKVGETRAEGPFELSQPPILDKAVDYEENERECGEMQFMLCKIADRVDD